MQREALAMYRALYNGVDHPALAAAINNVGLSIRAMRDRGALPLLLEALDMKRRLYAGADHPDLCTSLRNVGLLYLTESEFEFASPFLRDTCCMSMRLSPHRDTPELASSLYALSLSTSALQRHVIRQCALQMSFRIVLSHHRVLGSDGVAVTET